MAPEGGCHVQHWYAEQARAELSLYTDSVDAGLLRLRSALSSLESSLLSPEEASRFAAEQEIQRPERMFGVWAPGFD